jgi:hypothetical protein
MCDFRQLPTEIITEIYAYIDACSAWSLSCVCRGMPRGPPTSYHWPMLGDAQLQCAAVMATLPDYNLAAEMKPYDAIVNGTRDIYTVLGKFMCGSRFKPDWMIHDFRAYVIAHSFGLVDEIKFSTGALHNGRAYLGLPPPPEVSKYETIFTADGPDDLTKTSQYNAIKYKHAIGDSWKYDRVAIHVPETIDLICGLDKNYFREVCWRKCTDSVFFHAVETGYIYRQHCIDWEEGEHILGEREHRWQAFIAGKPEGFPGDVPASNYWVFARPERAVMLFGVRTIFSLIGDVSRMANLLTRLRDYISAEDYDWVVTTKPGLECELQIALEQPASLPDASHQCYDVTVTEHLRAALRRHNQQHFARVLESISADARVNILYLVWEDAILLGSRWAVSLLILAKAPFQHWKHNMSLLKCNDLQIVKMMTEYAQM